MQVNPLGCLSDHYYRNYYKDLPSHGYPQYKTCKPTRAKAIAWLSATPTLSPIWPRVLLARAKPSPPSAPTRRQLSADRRRPSNPREHPISRRAVARLTAQRGARCRKPAAAFGLKGTCAKGPIVVALLRSRPAFFRPPAAAILPTTSSRRAALARPTAIEQHIPGMRWSHGEWPD